MSNELKRRQKIHLSHGLKISLGIQNHNGYPSNYLSKLLFGFVSFGLSRIFEAALTEADAAIEYYFTAWGAN